MQVFPILNHGILSGKFCVRLGKKKKGGDKATGIRGERDAVGRKLGRRGNIFFVKIRNRKRRQ